MTDLTREIGLVSYGLAAAVSLVAARRTGAVRLWGSVALLHALFAVEVELKLRFDLKSVLRDLARGKGFDKSAVQAAGLVVATIVVLWLVALAVRRARGVRMVIFGVIFSVLVFLVETVSIHQVAGVLYRHVGPAAIIAWLWAAAALPVTLGALRARPRDG